MIKRNPNHSKGLPQSFMFLYQCKNLFSYDDLNGGRLRAKRRQALFKLQFHEIPHVSDMTFFGDILFLKCLHDCKAIQALITSHVDHVAASKMTYLFPGFPRKKKSILYSYRFIFSYTVFYHTWFPCSKLVKAQHWLQKVQILRVEFKILDNVAVLCVILPPTGL